MSTAHWTKPATRTPIIDKLVEGVGTLALSRSSIPHAGCSRAEVTPCSGPDRYNPQNVEILEDYLYQQMKQGEYDCLANLAILKL